MNFIKKALFVIACVGAIASTAQAAPIILSDVNDPTSNVLISNGVFLQKNSSTSFTLDITDGVNGFKSTIDKIISATFKFYLKDDGSLFDGDETYKLVLGSSLQTVTGSDISSCTFRGCPELIKSFTLNSAALADLAFDGKINVTLTSTEGDFYFDKATLDASVTKGTVPEPATTALLGLGLLGVAASRRKSAKSKNA